jgi:hypothetical protein
VELLNKDYTANAFVYEKLKVLYLMYDKHLFRSFLHNYKEKIFTKISEKGYATNAFLLENFSNFYL